MLDKIDTEMAFVNSALNLRAKRQEILAGNLANSDTPNYKARDMDFASALRAQMGGKGSQGGAFKMARTSDMHLSGTGSSTMSNSTIKFRSAVQPSLDGNTVDPDIERAHFSENAMHYQFMLERARGTIEKMKMALQEGGK